MRINARFGLWSGSGSVNAPPFCWLVARVRSAKRMENFACACGVGDDATAPELPELRLQYRQVCYTVDDVPDVFVEERVDALAVLSGASRKSSSVRISSRVMSRARQCRMNSKRSA